MSGALGALRAAVAEQLRENGVNAVAAMEPDRAMRWRAAVAAVGLVKAECVSGGFGDYLGTFHDPDSGKEREWYGREAALTLGIDIFAPRDGGAGACQQAAETVMETLLCQGAAGLSAQELQAGAVEFLEREGLYRLPVQCRCGAWLVARTDGGDGSFVDFEVRGSLK